MKIEDLPRPANYRRQMAKNGGYEMVPAYTAEEILGILEGVEKDAERYRWLRSNWFKMGASYPDGKVQFSIGGTRWSDQPESNIDDEIDSFIKKGQV